MAKVIDPKVEIENALVNCTNLDMKDLFEEIASQAANVTRKYIGIDFKEQGYCWSDWVADNGLSGKSTLSICQEAAFQIAQERNCNLDDKDIKNAVKEKVLNQQ